MDNYCTICGSKLDSSTGACPNNCSAKSDEKTVYIANIDEYMKTKYGKEHGDLTPEKEHLESKETPDKDKKRNIIPVIIPVVVLAVLTAFVIIVITKGASMKFGNHDLNVFMGKNIFEVSEKIGDMGEYKSSDERIIFDNGEILVEADSTEKIVKCITLYGKSKNKINGISCGMPVNKAEEHLKSERYFLTDYEKDEMLFENDDNRITFYIDSGTINSIVLQEIFSDKTEAKFNRAYATSVLPAQKNNGTTFSYSSDNTIDGDENTCWCEGVNGPGKGESITFYSDQPVNLNEIIIYNGYCKNEHVFYANNRLKNIKILFDNGKYTTVTLSDDYSKRKNHVKFNDTIRTRKVTIEIIDTYIGDEANDTCVSEVEFISP